MGCHIVGNARPVFKQRRALVLIAFRKFNFTRVKTPDNEAFLRPRRQEKAEHILADIDAVEVLRGKGVALQNRQVKRNRTVIIVKNHAGRSLFRVDT